MLSIEESRKAYQRKHNESKVLLGSNYEESYAEEKLREKLYNESQHGEERYE